MYVGQRLGYPDERIVRGTAAELTDGVYAPLSVALIENPHPDAVVTPGLPDVAFLRSAEGMPVVPMTKSEVRAVCPVSYTHLDVYKRQPAACMW